MKNLVASIVMLVISVAAWAQYPTRPIRLIVPAALKDEAVHKRLAASGSQPIGAGPEQLDAHIRSEISRWQRVLTAAGVQPTN